MCVLLFAKDELTKLRPILRIEGRETQALVVRISFIRCKFPTSKSSNDNVL